MPIFKPFRGIRPHSDILDIFPTRSINNFTEEELVHIVGFLGLLVLMNITMEK